LLVPVEHHRRRVIRLAVKLLLVEINDGKPSATDRAEGFACGASHFTVEIVLKNGHSKYSKGNRVKKRKQPPVRSECALGAWKNNSQESKRLRTGSLTFEF
jgi:hypothetical protein